jgi:hypothetical protein
MGEWTKLALAAEVTAVALTSLNGRPLVLSGETREA